MTTPENESNKTGSASSDAAGGGATAESKTSRGQSGNRARVAKAAETPAPVAAAASAAATPTPSASEAPAPTDGTSSTTTATATAGPDAGESAPSLEAQPSRGTEPAPGEQPGAVAKAASVASVAAQGLKEAAKQAGSFVRTAATVVRDQTAKALQSVRTPSAATAAMQAKAQTIRDDVAAAVHQRLNQPLSEAAQVELARLLTLLPRASAEQLVEREQAMMVVVDSLTGETPNVVIARALADELARSVQYSTGILSRQVYRVAGDSALGTLLASLFVFFVLFAVFMALFGPPLVPAAEATGAESLIGVLIFSAAIGGIVSILTRLDTYAKLTTFNPLLVAATAFVKPLVGIAFACLVFAIFNAGLLSVATIGPFGGSAATNPANVLGTVWIIGFLSGFSERFAKDFVEHAADTLMPGESVDAAVTGRSKRDTKPPAGDAQA